MSGHVIVCGMGHAGYRVVDLLLRLGETVTVITQSTRDEWLRDAGARGARVIIGDARDERLLVDAGVAGAAALLATADNDLTNVEIALNGKQLRPDIPVVLRLFDQTLAHELEAGLDIRRALAMSAIAAPSFAAAAMGERVVGSFTLEERPFFIGQLHLSAASPLAGRTVREVAGLHGLAVLARQPETQGETGPAAFVPEADTLLRPGDHVTVMGAGLGWQPLAGDALQTGRKGRAQHRVLRHTARHTSRVLEVGRHLWQSTPVALRTVFVVLNLIVVLSVFVFQVGLKLSFVDALYFVITTVTTVGYGDINIHDAPTALKLYGCVLMLVGSAMIATLYSIITDFVVAARFQQLIGRQRVPQQGHTVVVGLGNVGYRTVDALHRAGARVVAIERNPDRQFTEAVRSHAAVIIGDARVRATLDKAAVATAEAVIAATDDDVVNLSIGLAVKRMNPEIRTVVRLFDAGFARKVQSAMQVDAALSASKLAAPTFVATALYPDVLSAFVIDDHLFAILRRPEGDATGVPSPAPDRQAQSRVVMRRGPAGSEFLPEAHSAVSELSGSTLVAVRRDLRGPELSSW